MDFSIVICVKMCLFVWCGLISISSVFSYNIDTNFPKVFRRPIGEYFGFTVALHENREGPMALVGAPRANSSILREQLHQPGVLFSCPILQDDVNVECLEVKLDGRGNTQTEGGNEHTYYDKKDDMWLGVSLDIQQHAEQKDIVTCGHLWKNQAYIGLYLPNGVCYTINSELDPNSVKKLVPLVTKSKQSINSPGVYYYAFSQLGSSAAFSEDGNHLLLGAPGFFDWSGTVVSYSSDPKAVHDNYESPIIPDPPGGMNSYSYIGYSVTSGKFYDSNDMYVAVGAPRDGGSHGRVYIFKTLLPSASKIMTHQQKEGLQFGEYFGAAVLGVDLNNDKRTDLLVGAPFASSDLEGDEGKVYVYISNGMGLEEYTQLTGENKPNSRFGTAIANAGDLNQDGYNDIVIGAPYEDGSGAIYVYHGSKSGLSKLFVQKISAADISPSLSGFGIHISRGLDIDSNQYPDVLVGAYSSSTAVLFRTRPVVQVLPEISFNPKQLNTNITSCEYEGKKTSCVNVTICLSYRGKHAPLSLEFENEVFIEYAAQNLISSRGFFIHNGIRSSVFKQKSKLVIDENNCITNELLIQPGIKDVITPIQILYSCKLSEVANNNIHFNKSFPVIHPESPTNITSAVTFQTGCGKTDECFSDLVVTAKILEDPKDNTLIIGRDTKITLLIEVSNKREPAYLSELWIRLPTEITSINQDFCSSLSDQQKQKSNASLFCDLGNPFVKGKETKIQIKLDVSRVPTAKKKIFIFLDAKTVSTEVFPKDNSVLIPINFKAVSDISISGNPSEQIPYNEEAHGYVPVSISHTYFITNHGPSPVQTVDIELYVPISYQGQEFVTFTSLEADSGKPGIISAKCNDTYLQIKPIEPDEKIHGSISPEKELVFKERNGSNINDSEEYIFNKPTNLEEMSVTSRSKKSATMTTKKRKDFIINCDTAECKAIQCSTSPFQNTRSNAKIKVSVLVNMSLLNEFLDPWYKIEFVTKGKVTIRGDNGDLQPKEHYPDSTAVKTVIVHPGPPPSEEIDQWIIFVSIGVGVFLLILILILLIHFGFFKRKQKEKMKEMMTESNAKDYEPINDVESNDKLSD
ncbi:integrin alpha-9-like [Uloborus diversus]|uniref:integrin alpha-9-like n=1 Tax=Uloborus diversus TaxID=327109 RepID=UPI002409BE11|nr:integrin alpha-9-like [Uloborus diversus]